MLSLKRNLLMLLSGLLVPLHFLPGWIADLATALPFATIAYYPTMAYLGKLGSGRLGFWEVLILGLAWWAALRLLNVLLWRRAQGRLEVQGG